MSDDIIVADGVEALTVAQAARIDGGVILPDERDESPETTLSEWSE